MKKKLFIILTFVSTLFLGLAQFDVFTNPINKYAEDNTYLFYILLIAVLGSASLSLYLTILNPQKKLDEAKVAISTQLKFTAEQLRMSKKLKAHDVKFNVMETCYYKGLIYLYPKTSQNSFLKFIPDIFPKIFKSVWGAPNGFGIPKTFVLGVRQGSSGKAMNLRADQNDLSIVSELPLYTLHDKDESFAEQVLLLNSKQHKAIEGITVLFSIPIYKIFDGKATSDLIGVLTLESRSTELATMIGTDIELESKDQPSQDSIKEALCTTMVFLRDEYSRLYVKY